MLENPLVLRFYLCETVQISLHLIYNPKSFFLFTVFEDIGEKVMIGELNNKVNYSYMLICTLSHELYTPLNHLQSGIDNLLTTSSNPKLQDRPLKDFQEDILLLKYIEKGLDLFVQNILDFAKHINRSLAINCQKFNLKDEINEMTNLFKVKAKKKRIRFDFECPDLVLNTDKDKLLGVLYLFLDNSMKHTNSGGVSLTVREGRSDDFVEFEIIDSGTGIEEEDLDKLRSILNNPFSNVRTAQSAGVGIGFRVAQVLIMYLTDGDMTLEIKSLKGTGTTICFDVLKSGRQVNPLKIQAAHLKTIVANDKKEELEARFNSEREGIMKASSPFSGEAGKEIDNFSRRRFPLSLPLSNSSRGIESRPSNVESPQKNHRLITATIYADNNSNSKAKEKDNNFLFQSPSKKDPFDVTPLYDFSLKTPLHKSFNRKVSNMSIEGFGRKTALVVDDEILNAEFLQAQLECYDIEVSVVYDGEQALEHCIKSLTFNQKIDIVFMDYSMPNMNGDKCTERLRSSKFDSILKNTPIIGLTAHKDELITQQCLSAGMTKVAYKPFSASDARVILSEFNLIPKDV